MNDKFSNQTLIRAIIGLGNPGLKFLKTRHNIGFRIVDEIAIRYFLSWNKKDLMEISKLVFSSQEQPKNFSEEVILIKPQTFMNDSGKVINFLTKQGIKPEEILVAHDELEKPFGYVGLRFGGSAKGHNGLRSIINVIGENFWRLRFGIGRPEDRSEVSNFVLSNFSKEEEVAIYEDINKATDLIFQHLN